MADIDLEAIRKRYHALGGIRNDAGAPSQAEADIRDLLVLVDSGPSGDPAMNESSNQPDVAAERGGGIEVRVEPESLESFLARLDDSALKLTVIVGVLQGLNGRIITHLYGTGGAVPRTEDAKRGPPSLVSLNDDFDTQLEALSSVVESLVNHVGPFDLDDRDEEPPPERVAVGPRTDRYDH